MRRERHSGWRAGLAIGCAMLGFGCMGIDVSEIERAREPVAVGEADAYARGRIVFVVDGRVLDYGLLNKPALQLFRRDDGQYLATPEVGGDGRFLWRMRPGNYGVAVIHGGMGPTDQFHAMLNGHSAFVHGFVDPGIEFVIAPGRVNELGTLRVVVESKPADALLGGRVFARLVEIAVEDVGNGPGFRRVQRNEPGSSSATNAAP